MRGTLVPSVKVARTTSNWPSTPHTPLSTVRDVVLRLEFAAAEDRVALRIDRLVELAGRIAATGEVLVAHHAGEAAEDEAGEARVVGGRLEAQRARCAPQADFDRVRDLDRQVRIADVEGRGRVMRPAREQLGRLRRALDALRRDAGDEILRQVLDQADADALRRERERALSPDRARCRRAGSRRESPASCR